MAEPLLTCPHCGLRADPEVFLTEAANTRALVAALRMPESLAVAVIGYLRLHSPAGKAMATSKRERLLSELVAYVQSGEVYRDGLTQAAPRELWQQALQRLVEQPPADLPLSGHGYLLEVVAGLARRAAGGAEQQREAALRNGRREPGPRPAVERREPGPQPAARVVDRAAGRLGAAALRAALHGEAGEPPADTDTDPET